MKRMLDLFCGRLGWSKAFLARGWKCVGIDMVDPPENPAGFQFVHCDIACLNFDCLRDWWIARGKDIQMLGQFDFICASSPCEEFSVHGMKHFHPNPKYPENGIRLFNHTREICEASGVPYVMENVRAAQQFVGRAVHHCGPFYLWGTGVPTLLGQGFKKDTRVLRGTDYEAAIKAGIPIKEARRKWQQDFVNAAGGRKASTAIAATIPPELANCVAAYAERLLETSHEQATGVPGRAPVEPIS